MKAIPLRPLTNGKPGYEQCSPEEATHVRLHFPGPLPNRVIPVLIKGKRHGTNCWTWNGDTEKPTLRPSILTKTEHGEERTPIVCHSHVNDGIIHFLDDCTHSYAGQFVPLLEVD